MTSASEAGFCRPSEQTLVVDVVVAFLDLDLGSCGWGATPCGRVLSGFFTSVPLLRISSKIASAMAMAVIGGPGPVGLPCGEKPGDLP